MSSSDEEEDLDLVTLVTDDGDELDVERWVAERCSYLKTILTEDAEVEDGEAVSYISDVSMWSLHLIMDYCQYDWPGDERVRYPPLEARLPEEDKDDSEKTLLAMLSSDPVDANVLCELASASYQLDCKPLVEATCRAIAGTIKGRSAEEIRRIFSIVNDFTPAEEEQVRLTVLERTMMLPPPEPEAELPEKPACSCSAIATGGPNSNPEPNSIRDKLRMKLFERQSKCQQRIARSVEQTKGDDVALSEKLTMDELVAFIEQGDDDRRKKKKKRNKARRKLKKKVGETPTVTYEQGEASNHRTHRNEDSMGGSGVDQAQPVTTPLVTSNVERLEEEKELDGVDVADKTCEVEELIEAMVFEDACHGSTGDTRTSLSRSTEAAADSVPSDAATDNVLDVRLVRQLLVRVEELESRLQNEQMARRLVERRLAQVESSTQLRVASCEEAARALEARLRLERQEHDDLFKKLERRQAALEGVLVSPSTSRPTRSRMLFPVDATLNERP